MANPKLSIILNVKDDATKNLDEVRKSFDRIKNSGVSVKAQLKALQQNLIEMNNAGLNTTSLFTEMTEYAGQLKDAIGDASTAISAFANDTFKIEAGAQAFQLGVVAGNSLASTLDLLGIKNDEVAEAIKKVQMAMTLLNGVQQVANIFNKDSALMLRIKQIQLKANTVATTQDTASTTSNTAATAGNTVATATNTAATATATAAKNGLNTAIAIGKALMGDWTGLLLIGAAALTTYAIAAGDSKDATEADTKAVDENREARKKFAQEAAASAAQLVTKYNELKTAYERCRTEGERQQWIKENAREFENLGLKVNDVTSAERVFVTDTDKVVKALELRARAAALQSMKVDAWKKYYEDTLDADRSITSGMGTNFKNDELASLFRTWEGSKYRSELSYFVKDGKFTEKGAQDFNDFLKRNGKHLVTSASIKAGDTLDKTLAGIQKAENNIQKQYNNLGISDSVSLTPTKSHSSGSGSSTSSTQKPATQTPAKEEPVYDESSIKYASERVSEFRKAWEEAPESMRPTIKSQLDYWEAELKRRKGEVEKEEVKIETVIDPKSLAGLELQLQEVTDKLKLANPEDEEYIKNLRQQYQTLGETISQVREELGFDQTETEIMSITDAVDQLGSSFAGLGNAIGGTAGQIVSFTGQLTAQTSKFLENMAQTIVASQAAATAQGIQSAAGLVFPYNIAAIASTVALIASLFASLPKFESGGIVPGSSYVGDRTLVRANAGEMILNQRQQNNLYKAIASNQLGGGGVSGNVVFTITGDKLVGVLNNHNSKIKRQS